MVAPPLCPACGALAVGEKCGACGTLIARPPASAAADMLSVAVPGLQLDTVEDSRSRIAAVESQPRHRKAAAYLALQPSEQAVLAAASRIFAAYVASGVVTDDNQHDLSDRSVKLATRMALVIEKYVQSDDEDW